MDYHTPCCKMRMLFQIIFGLATLLWVAYANPISFGASRALLPTSTTQNHQLTRVTRSCSNGVHSLLLGACNKNHKRSPIIMSLIYVEYFVPPDISSNHIGGLSPEMNPLEQPDQPFDIPWPSFQDDAKNFFETISNAIRDHTMEDDFVDLDPIQRNLQVLSLRERIKRVPGSGASYHSVMEKCCSAEGCTEMDFLSQCF